MLLPRLYGVLLLLNLLKRIVDNFTGDHQVSAKSDPMRTFPPKRKHFKTFMRSITRWHSQTREQWTGTCQKMIQITKPLTQANTTPRISKPIEAKEDTTRSTTDHGEPNRKIQRTCVKCPTKERQSKNYSMLPHVFEISRTTSRIVFCSANEDHNTRTKYCQCTTNFHTTNVPSTQYRCGSKNWEKFSILQLSKSSFDWIGKIIPMVKNHICRRTCKKEQE